MGTLNMLLSRSSSSSRSEAWDKRWDGEDVVWGALGDLRLVLPRPDRGNTADVIAGVEDVPLDERRAVESVPRIFDDMSVTSDSSNEARFECKLDKVIDKVSAVMV